jgi:hypothetical protein
MCTLASDLSDAVNPVTEFDFNSIANYRSLPMQIYPPCGKRIAIQSERRSRAKQHRIGPMSNLTQIAGFFSK